MRRNIRVVGHDFSFAARADSFNHRSCITREKSYNIYGFDELYADFSMGNPSSY